ncbi:MAG TPA: GTPase Era [Chloroflexi bacterium]|nr:GTPase Era [Chloroflexota bacterium]
MNERETGGPSPDWDDELEDLEARLAGKAEPASANLEWDENFKAGFVAVIGRPNVGKSTLMNLLLGQKVAAVSPKPQTTRRQQLGILTTNEAQVIFIDTPGIHVPVHKLGEYMNEVALDTLGDADLILWVLDAGEPPREEDRLIAERLNALKDPPPVLLALNKVDRLGAEEKELRRAAFEALYPAGRSLWISAAQGLGTVELVQAVLEQIPQHPPYYDPDQITDYYERDIAGELVREAALLHLRDEVPHGIAVRIDEYTERGETGAYIAATIFVERESQKAIVIGQKGEMLKRIGTTARQQIQEMSGRKVYLELRVKVNKNWRNNEDALRLMGYTTNKT